jgi:hypothetical protein
VTNPKIQIPNPNHSQLPNPKTTLKLQVVRLEHRGWEYVWALGVGLGIWALGVVGIWDLELGI